MKHHFSKKILLTGACGYIGSHTLVDLFENGFDVISIDNLSRGYMQLLKGVEKITGKSVQNYAIDLCDASALHDFFDTHPDINGIIHFAAYKSVNESVREPLLYYHNNIASLVNLLQEVQQRQIPHFIFSSSCSVYGNVKHLPVTENTPLPTAESPYGFSKQIGETMIRDMAQVCPQQQFVLLRYFNPVGAHPSAIIGEIPHGTPENLVPYITQTAIGKREQLTVYGNDYPTRDGSCIRDYIHVCDIASAHTKALQYLMDKKNTGNCEVFNLGSGEGVSVLELIQAFEQSTGKALNYRIGARRAGDVVAVYADNTLAKEKLGWIPQYGVADMMQSAWKWEQYCANSR